MAGGLLFQSQTKWRAEEGAFRQFGGSLLQLRGTTACEVSSMRHTVLTVDNNETHRCAVARVLEKEGYELIQACTGADALRLARNHCPDIILLDIHLPDVNGLELCRKLKSDPRTGRIPVIVHTASAGGSAAEQSLAFGACAFLTSPIEPDHLVHVVRGCVARALPPGAAA
jgi:two-component system NtrC family sensor kinase